MSDAISKALKTAFELGKTYWMQADSQSFAEQRRSDETFAKFRELESSTLQALQSGEPVAWRLRRDDVDYGITAYDKAQVGRYVQDGWQLVGELYTTPQPVVDVNQKLVEALQAVLDCGSTSDQWWIDKAREALLSAGKENNNE